MNITKETPNIKLLKTIQFIVLIISFAWSGLFNNLSSIYYIAPQFSGLYEIDNTFIIFTLFFTALLFVGMYYAFIKVVYYLSSRFYVSMYIKTHKFNSRSLEFPINYNDFSFILAWFIIVSNIIIGFVRLIYFKLPYTIDLIETVVPIIISVSTMFIFFSFIKKKYFNDNYFGITFVSLSIPYILYVFILL